MKNELAKKRIEKMYKDYYADYNTWQQKFEEKKEERKVEGLVSWVEPGKDSRLRTLKILVGEEQI